MLHAAKRLPELLVEEELVLAEPLDWAEVPPVVWPELLAWVPVPLPLEVVAALLPVVEEPPLVGPPSLGAA
jgi:hypothetical protein